MSTPAAQQRPWEAEDYLAAVSRRLADLPAEERAALLEDLALHLEALRAEDDDRSIETRLGPADAYAAELRSAAGLPAQPSPSAASPVGEDLRRRIAELLAHPWAREVLRLATELRPAWWVVRGYLLVLVLCSLTDSQREGLIPTPLGSKLLGFLLVLAAIAGSVALGRRELPRRIAVPVVGAGVLLALAGLVELQYPLLDEPSPTYYVDPVSAEQATGEYPLLSRFGPVTDVLPYAADGTPLEGVLLFDQDGRPLQVGQQEWWADGCARVADHPLAADGVPVTFSFPQDYVLQPGGMDLYGWPVAPGQCTAELPRPEVPLPVFPPADPAAGTTTAAPTTTAPTTTAPVPTPGG